MRRACERERERESNKDRDKENERESERGERVLTREAHVLIIQSRYGYIIHIAAIIS